MLQNMTSCVEDSFWSSVAFRWLPNSVEMVEHHRDNTTTPPTSHATHSRRRAPLPDSAVVPKLLLILISFRR